MSKGESERSVSQPPDGSGQIDPRLDVVIKLSAPDGGAREEMMSSTKQQQEWAEAKARRSLEAAQRDEVFKAMQRAEEERIEAKTMRLRVLRTEKESPKPDR